MDPSHLQNLNKNINDAIDSKRLSVALEHLYTMAASAQAPWETRNEIDSLRQSYGYLRTYALNGAVDPSRDVMLAEIASKIKTLSQQIIRYSQIGESPKQYFGVVRMERINGGSLQSLLNEFTEISSRMNMALLGGNPYGASSQLTALRRLHDDLAGRLFNFIWTSYPLNNDDLAALEKVLTDDIIPVERRAQLLGAIMLGALEYYDERRLILLAKVYLNGYDALEIRALVALILVLWMQRNQISGSGLKSVMDSVREKKSWIEDLKMVFLNLVRTRDTDRITQTMREEVIPGMMKLRPEIFKKFRDADGKSSDEIAGPDMEFNPEWEDLLEKSGVADKLKELNKLQAEGGDVMLSTFGGLKHFPFFNQVANWFLPFYLDQTDVSAVLGESASDLGEMIDMAPMICDNDKYSMVLSLENLPASNRRVMIEQMRSQNIDLAELRNSLLSPEMTSRNVQANHYIHDLYRFFTLYRRKSEFSNPFATPINLASVTILAADIQDSVALEAVAEFYFKRGYYEDALEVFNRLSDDNDKAATRLQKIGFCYQQLGRNREALDAYSKSELLNPDSQWLMRRIAHTYKMLGLPKEAIGYYHKLVGNNPDDKNLALNLGHCYLAANDYTNALKEYYRVEYLDNTGTKARRPIAWCLFVQGEFERSEAYYKLILEREPTPSDYLNYGHLLLSMHKYKQAADNYRKYLEAKNGDVAALDSAIDADIPYLENAGVEPTMIAITIDAALYPDTTKHN